MVIKEVAQVLYSFMLLGRREPSLLSSGRLAVVVMISPLASSEKLMLIGLSSYLTICLSTALMICSVLSAAVSIFFKTGAISELL